MADMNIGVTITRTDRREPLYDGAILTPDVNSAEGGDKIVPNDSTEVNLWTSSLDGSGSAFTDDAFNSLTIIVDPDRTIADDEQDIGGWIKVYTTPIAGGASAANTYLERVTRRNPFMLSSARRGATVSGGRMVTKIGALNDDATNDIPFRTIVQ